MRWPVRMVLVAVPAVMVGLVTVGSASAAPGHSASPSPTASDAAGGGLGLVVKATPRKVRPGQKVSVTLTATNEFDVSFASVIVRAKGAPDCTGTDLGRLAAGASKTHTCTVIAPKQSGAYRVSVSAVARTSYEDFEATASATYNVKTYQAKPAPTHVATPAPPGLPVTGPSSPPYGIAGAGVILIVLGGLLVIFSRRPHRRS